MRWGLLLVAFVARVTAGLTFWPSGLQWYSPAAEQVANVLEGSSNGPVALITAEDLCSGVVNASLVKGSVLIVQHLLVGSSCQRVIMCVNAAKSGAIAVVDSPDVDTPVGVLAASSNLRPKLPLATCQIPFVLATFQLPSPRSRSSAVALLDVIPGICRSVSNCSAVVEASENGWTSWCQRGYFQTWQWMSLSISALLLVLSVVVFVVLARRDEKVLTYRQLCALLCALCTFWIVVRVAVNPSNCYGAAVYAWSSEVDGFLFTAHIPPALSAVILVAFMQLAVVRAGPGVKQTSTKLAIVAGVCVALLFLTQIVLSAVVQAGFDATGALVVLQSVVYVVFYLAALVFYLWAFVLLCRRIANSPTQSLSRLFPLMVLSLFVITASLCALASAIIVLAEASTSYAGFLAVECLAVASSLCCVVGALFFLWPRKSAARRRTSSSVTAVRLSVPVGEE